MDLWLVLTLAEVAWVLIVGVIIVMQRRSPTATLAWLLGMALLPVIGLIVYWLIGPVRLERRRSRRTRSRRAVEQAMATMAHLAHTSQEQAQLAMVGIGSGQVEPLPATSIDLYADGRSAYGAMLQAIAGAQHHIHLEYYIWQPDQIGTRIRDALIERAKAGVEVRLLLDGVGAYAVHRRYLAPLIAAEAEVAWFNPVINLRGHFRRADFRSHRKIIVVDGEIGFTGGLNVDDCHSMEFSPGKAWRDTHVRFEGTAVRALQRIFLEDWGYAAREIPEVDRELFPEVDEPGTKIVQVVGSGPDGAEYGIQRMLFTACGQAQHRLWLTTPYFVPDEAFLMGLTTAALRGVDVRLLVPARSDSRLVDAAARSYFLDLLTAGVKIYEYLPRFVHAKVSVFDDDVAIVGTANLDNRSFRLNFEIAAVLYDHASNAALAADFERDLGHARALRIEDVSRLRFRTRLGQAGARLLSPLL
jgi:cardiolipin synthase